MLYCGVTVFMSVSNCWSSQDNWLVCFLQSFGMKLFSTSLQTQEIGEYGWRVASWPQFTWKLAIAENCIVVVVVVTFFNPCTGVGSKMTPGVTLRVWHDGEIEVTAVDFHENYSTGGRYLFLLLSRKICFRLKVTPSLYGVIFDPRTILRSCLTRLWKIAQIMEFISFLRYAGNTTYLFFCSV